MLNKRRISTISICLMLAMFAAGCKKKAPPPPPPPPPPVAAPAPPPPAAPSITSFTAEPSSIERGQSSTLTWTATDASSVSIDNTIGAVQPTGNRRVFPGSSTTYTLTATGPGGTKTATATVNVTEPAPPPPPPVVVKQTFEQMLSGTVVDAYIDYDKSDIREEARAALTRDADALKAIFSSFPDASVTIEGHCDERGSAEYNLDQRMLEQITGVRRHALAEQQAGRNETIEGRSQLRVRPARHRRQGVPGSAGCSGRQAEDHQLRQGTSAVYRPHRGVLAEEPPRALLYRAVKSGKGRAVPAHPQPAGWSIRPAHEEIL